jgi:hypothetical protein
LRPNLGRRKIKSNMAIGCGGVEMICLMTTPNFQSPIQRSPPLMTLTFLRGPF